MENNFLISVVIPIYNVEKYLDRCVKSVFSQTYRRLEIILVDDGSPDRSPDLCDAFAKEDQRIKVIHQKNGGLSAARNSGVSVASGDFVFFLDADDQILPDTIETLVRMLYLNRSDIAIVGFATLSEGKALTLPHPIDSFTLVLSSEEALITMLYQKKFDTSAWGKLIPLDVAKRFPFPCGRVYEDLATVYKWFLSVNRIAYSAEAKYVYMHNIDGIISQSASFKNAADEKYAIDSLYQTISETHLNILPAVRARRFSTYCHILLTFESRLTQHTAFISDIRCVLAQDCFPVMLDLKARIKNRFGAAVYFFFRDPGLRVINRLIHRILPCVDRSLNIVK